MLVERGDLSSILAETAGAANVRPTPIPAALAEAQLLVAHVALAVEEVGSVNLLLRVVADDLDPSDRRIAYPSVRRMENEKAPRCPFVDVARGNLHRIPPGACD